MKCNDWQGHLPLAPRIVFLGHRLVHLAERRLNVHGYNHTQATIIMALSRRSGVMAQELAGPVRVEPASVTRALQALERRGLIAREPHPSDGRASLFSLTPEGAAAAELIGRVLREVSQEIEAVLSPVDAEVIRLALDRMLTKVDALRGAAV